MSSSPPSVAAAITSPPCLLSNGRYTVMLRAAGTGFSRWLGSAVTRWREDPVADPWGSYLLLRDEDNAAAWSTTRQPFGDDGAHDTVDFNPGLARFGRRAGDLESLLDVAVADDADLELRRLTLINHGDAPRTLSLTSYAELVLGSAAADDTHPAFSKMFVQTEWDAAHRLLLATRRRRSASEATVWAAHALQVEGRADDDAIEYETDRARFLGRGRSVRQAFAMQAGRALSNSAGCVLDPVFSLRRRVTLAPGARVRLLSWTQLADSRDGALALAARVADADAGDRVFDGARRHAMVTLERFGVGSAQANRFAVWLGGLLVVDPTQRAAPERLARGHGGAPVLWAKGISGDRPIVLVRIGSTDELARLAEVLLAQRYWQAQQVGVDVVVLNAATGKTADALQGRIDPLAATQQAALKDAAATTKSEVFALREDAIDTGLRDGLFTVARVLLDDGTGTRAQVAPAAPLPTSRPFALVPAPAAASAAAAPEFDNGIGGFVDAGRAYRIRVDPDRPTPAPWVNVIANPAFGFMVSADGGGYTWSLNSQQNPLTPWPNDPVSDSPHDILYIRDDDSGELWSATALPVRVPGARCTATHGKGWSRFTGDAHGIELDLVQCVPTAADPVKLSRLRLCNRGDRTRCLSVTGYVEWALGANGGTPAPFVVTERDAATGAVLARNRWRPEFAERVAFYDMGGCQQSASGDRAAFLGPFGDVACPAALRGGDPLPGRFGAGLDPCGALQAHIELPAGSQVELRFLLGDAASTDEARTLLGRYRDIDLDGVLRDVRAQWDDMLDTVQVRTPDRAMDIMLNDWLPYQALACRVWARTAYYQASGAYGFRDQLQDVMALCVARPDVARAQLLRAAGRQFVEGDVQHWWLPPAGKGIRTRISDDRGWLPYVAAHYIEVTADAAVLDEKLPFLAGPELQADADEAFFQPGVAAQKASVYEHCARAIDVSLTRGTHGLPLIGTGDWNDGMNAVGEQGRGESSWLGWFLLAAIEAFAPHARQRGDDARVTLWQHYATDLRVALEQAWDGAWYRRGYYDDGAPLGSHESRECQIDCIAQSWSLIAGATDLQRSAQAMASVDAMLIDREHRVARLFTPPFDHSDRNPGYIKGYPPGVRENGGQYTHGAIWSVFAWAELGDGDRAGALFDLLNPIAHAATPDAVERYKVEPYVVCADVYSVAPHAGRGGWTWYTGSAGWLYRAGLEAVLGFHLRGDRLLLDPCIPKHWPGFDIVYRHRGANHVTRYEIVVQNPAGRCRGVATLEIDGIASTVDAGQPASIALDDDGKAHRLRIVLG